MNISFADIFPSDPPTGLMAMQRCVKGICAHFSQAVRVAGCANASQKPNRIDGDNGRDAQTNKRIVCQHRRKIANSHDGAAFAPFSAPNVRVMDIILTRKTIDWHLPVPTHFFKAEKNALLTTSCTFWYLQAAVHFLFVFMPFCMHELKNV